MLVTHHGSRGSGVNLYKRGMCIAEQFRKKLSPDTLKQNVWVPFETSEGKNYREALQIVRKKIKINHEVIRDRILNELQIKKQKD
ncbi:RtcB family protein [Tenacibaculum maritimum]|uniref:RtcB family protein n=1 Tax=Tenacibaculum maritimum TaxID=107401 RepID=UPI001F33D88F|nr:RtcB family protein [Tenacibaculum maritimum]